VRHYLLVLVLYSLATSAESQGSTPPPATFPASAPATEDKMRKVADSTLGACLRKQPTYPVAALRQGLSGRTTVAFSISPEGAIENQAIARSSGHVMLDQAALAHLQKCVTSFDVAKEPQLPTGRYALPLVWRLVE
jgi:protein TonB